MERETILKALGKLPAIPVGKVPDDNEIFEGDEHNAHFKITLNTARAGGTEISYWTLSISGDEEGKRKLAEDFTKALGTPTDSRIEPAMPHITFYSWLISASKS